MLLRSILLLCSTISVASSYSVLDDASWAVYDTEIANDVLGYDRQHVYNEYMEGCRKMAGETRAADVCDRDERWRLTMNVRQPRAMINFTEVGFKKTRAPAAVMEVIEKFWLANRDKGTIEWGTATPYHNTWEAEPTIIGIENESLEGGGYALRSRIASFVRDEMEKWTGMKQAISSVYGIRSYHNGSILAPHVDRLPLVSSAILNVAQDVEEDWPLEVYDHNGVAHNVTMKPGDLVLYESHSIIHGRPFALNGRFFANIFIHFEPLGPFDATAAVESVHNDIKYPPYLIPGSDWEGEWQSNYPKGWNVLEDAPRLVRDGDLSTIQYAATIHPDIWNGTEQWTPIHEAVRHGHYEVIRFLVEELRVDLSRSCHDYPSTPYKLAISHLGHGHPITQYLRSIRGVVEYNEVDQDHHYDEGHHDEHNEEHYEEYGEYEEDVDQLQDPEDIDNYTDEDEEYIPEDFHGDEF